MALAFDDGAVHGPLEILLTVDEETGLTGAQHLDPAMINGRIMLNLDSQSSAAVCIGCAGGGGVDVHLPLAFETPEKGARAFRCLVDGLKGGHSGLDIHENRGNAIKLLADMLVGLEPLGMRLAWLCGGDKHNAIPRSASAGIVVPGGSVEAMHRGVQEGLQVLREGYPHEANLAVSITRDDLSASVLTVDSQKKALRMLIGFPHGVFAMSRTMAGLVETSNNLATVSVDDGVLRAHNSPRSSHPRELDLVVRQITAVADLAGATSTAAGPYPGWPPNPESPLLQVVENVYMSLFGVMPERRAVHAGLECGIIGNLCGGMDMVSIGPDIKNCHSPS
jgi:dipeptidase D